MWGSSMKIKRKKKSVDWNTMDSDAFEIAMQGLRKSDECREGLIDAMGKGQVRIEGREGSYLKKLQYNFEINEDTLGIEKRFGPKDAISRL